MIYPPYLNIVQPTLENPVVLPSWEETPFRNTSLYGAVLDVDVTPAKSWDASTNICMTNGQIVPLVGLALKAAIPHISNGVITSPLYFVYTGEKTMTVTTIPQEITPPGSLDDLVPGMLIRCDGETLRYHGFRYHTDLPFDLSFSKPMPSERNHILMREEDGYPGVVNVAERDKVERYVILEERDFTFQPFMGSSLGRWIIVHDQPEIDVKYSIVNQKSNGLHRKTSVFVTETGLIRVD